MVRRYVCLATILPQTKGNFLLGYVFERHFEGHDQKNVILAPLIDYHDPDYHDPAVSREPNILI